MPLLDISDTGSIAALALFTLLTLVALVTVPPVGLVMGIGLVVAVAASALGVGPQRAEAGWRVAAGAWLVTVGIVIGTVVVIVAGLWGLLDVIIQFIAGRNILSEQSRPANLVAATFEWGAGQATFATTGGGDGRFYPVPMMS